MSAYETLRKMDISGIPPKGWDAFYAEIAPWLTANDSEVRASAAERLSMAVFWAEPMSFRRYDGAAVDDARSVARLHWLLGTIGDAHERHGDVIPALLKRLRHHGDHAPFAARRLGDRAYGESDPSDEEVTATVVEKELTRPGVLGPFWSTRHDFDDQHRTALWLLDILERREGWPPPGLPFNDIDFYLHELCSTSPDLVRRMLDNGFEELAYMTATEHAARIDGMEPLLKELAQSSNPYIAASAARHLANQFGPDGPEPLAAPHPRP